MISAVEERVDDLKRLCIRYGVQQLDLFGSASTGRYDSVESDLDFVVEFRPETRLAYADAYFGLLESLERRFGKPVDLVVGWLGYQESVFPAIRRGNEDSHPCVLRPENTCTTCSVPSTS